MVDKNHKQIGSCAIRASPNIYTLALNPKHSVKCQPRNYTQTSIYLFFPDKLKSRAAMLQPLINNHPDKKYIVVAQQFPSCQKSTNCDLFVTMAALANDFLSFLSLLDHDWFNQASAPRPSTSRPRFTKGIIIRVHPFASLLAARQLSPA